MSSLLEDDRLPEIAACFEHRKGRRTYGSERSHAALLRARRHLSPTRCDADSTGTVSTARMTRSGSIPAPAFAPPARLSRRFADMPNSSGKEPATRENDSISCAGTENADRADRRAREVPRLISWKVGVYEERLAQGTAAHLWTAARRLGSKNRDCRVARDRNHAPGLTQRSRSKLRRYTLLSGISREAAVGVGGRAARRARLLSRRRAKDTSRTSARATGLGQASCRRVSVR